ncbi:hypothetical protein [Fictibacillus halophilus]|uniref:hypothetical protein n=1 Tax=Fictibacillus halophilus TaxID=1610490 RepID=UPI001CFBE479|nr:hypothetical protein [Fictibacillus halophilus]
MSINKVTLGELLKAYKDISTIIEDIEYKEIDEIKSELEIILTFPLGEAIFSLFERIDVNTLEKSLAEYIRNNDKADPDKFLDFMSLYLKRINKNKN